MNAPNLEEKRLCATADDKAESLMAPVVADRCDSQQMAVQCADDAYVVCVECGVCVWSVWSLWSVIDSRVVGGGLRRSKMGERYAVYHPPCEK